LFNASLPIVTALLKAAEIPILVFDAHFCLTACNTAASVLLGIEGDVEDPSALAGHPIAPPMLSWLQGSPLPEEWSPSGNLAYRPRVEPIGGGEGWVIVLHDVSEIRRQARSQAEFLRLVAHDMRSPLTSAHGFASMLDQQISGPLNDRQKHFVQKVLASLTVITALVENIQDADRFSPETGFYEMHITPCDPGEIAQRIVKGYIMPSEKPDLSVQVNVKPDVPIIAADATMLERAVVNLVDNAVKYTPNGGHVEVEVYRANDEVVIGVRDTGLGIAPEHQHRLFQRHSRIVREEFKKVKGTGLGLFIVRSVAQRHGGRAWVQSEPGQGSTFFLSLPVKSK
jgi:signal transduction histidine kinase